nr:FHA domain-containing protein [Methylomarinum sp. Ch1-1]MDP4520077.1 FHA domain-containing protein [Methylomarinum sp. Ch1-1]
MYLDGFLANDHRNQLTAVNRKPIPTYAIKYMPVSLKIVAFKGQPYENGEAVIIDREGGTIGRQDSCDLFLPDTEKIISRHHAKIGFENDAFMLSDTSLGGTFIDENPAPIKQTSIKLVDGMILGIGEYQIQVSLLPDSAGADEGGRRAFCGTGYQSFCRG